MQSINALSLAPTVNEWLSNTHSPRILHLFERACNLINERREILSIVMPEIGNGPFNLVIEDPVYFSEQLNFETPVSCASAELSLGNLIVHTSGAQLWNPRPDWEKLHATRDDIARQLAKIPVLNNHAPGLHELIAQTIQDDTGIARQSLTASLSRALVNADFSSASGTTSRLAGLGAGLTPAGDDFIMGAIFAVWIIHPFERACILAAEVANKAATLTTSLSAAWLRSAGEGEAGILWHRFFDALQSFDIGSVQGAIDKILSVGESSGADAFAGFFSTMNTSAEPGQPKSH